MDDKLKTGCEAIDILLDGGVETGVISTVFGPAGSGKTTFCLLCLKKVLKESKKAIFIDTEGGFSLTRISQIMPNYKEYMDQIIILKPTTFEKQEDLISNIERMINETIGIIIVDTISSLYRVEFSSSNDKSEMIKKLGKQLNILNKTAREKNIPLVLTNQVYASFEEKDQVKMVGGDILNYSSKALIEIQKINTKRKAIVKKHRSIAENKEVIFRIIEKGFELCQ